MRVDFPDKKARRPFLVLLMISGRSILSAAYRGRNTSRSSVPDNRKPSQAHSLPVVFPPFYLLYY